MGFDVFFFKGTPDEYWLEWASIPGEKSVQEL